MPNKAYKMATKPIAQLISTLLCVMPLTALAVGGDHPVGDVEQIQSHQTVAPQLNLQESVEIVKKRSEELALMMRDSGLPASDAMLERIAEALFSAREEGTIVELNAVWKDAYAKAMQNDNASRQALLSDIGSATTKEDVLVALKQALDEKISIENDQALRDLFLVDFVNHLMSIAAIIDLVAKTGEIDEDSLEILRLSLNHHDNTKIFEDEGVDEEDGRTVRVNNLINNLKGYMLLPLIFGVAQKHELVKEHQINIAAETKEGGMLQATVIAVPICSHVTKEPHHPEYHIIRGKAMEDIDMLAMIVDGFAAGSRPDRTKSKQTFKAYTDNSMQFWLMRLGKTDSSKGDWRELDNNEALFAMMQTVTDALVKAVGDVPIATYMGTSIEEDEQSNQHSAANSTHETANSQETAEALATPAIKGRFDDDDDDFKGNPAALISVY